MEGLELKKKLLKTSGDLVGDKIARLQQSNKEAQEAANNETKSSAGDKYETGRAMAHLETERIASQMAELAKLQKVLSTLDADRVQERAQLGSLVTTDTMSYYISVGLGKVEIEGRVFFCISPVAPVGRLLLGKSVGDTFQFQGREHQITGVC